MWQFLLAAAVAGSTGFVAKRFIKPSRTDPSVVPEEAEPCREINEDLGNDIDQANLDCPTSLPLLGPNGFYKSGFGSNSETTDGIFAFSSVGSSKHEGSRTRGKKLRKKSVIERRRSKDGTRIAKVEQGSDVEFGSEQRKGGRILHLCLKRRRTTKNLAEKVGFNSSEDSCLFGCGLSFGIIYMMSAGKSEMSKLNKAMDETARAVQELKSELNKRKSSHTPQILNSVNNVHMNSHNVSGRNNELYFRQASTELRDADIKTSSVHVSDDGECCSSALTEDPDPRGLEMDQLEAELECELKRLPGCTINGPRLKDNRPKVFEDAFSDDGCHHKTEELDFKHVQSQGVSASELNQKLSHLLIEQQENQIVDLEAELQLAQSKLHEKDAELQALKDCVRSLTELSLSTVSDDENETVACNDGKGTSNCDANRTGSNDKSKQSSIVGVKRPIDSESSAYSPTMTVGGIEDRLSKCRYTANC